MLRPKFESIPHSWVRIPTRFGLSSSLFLLFPDGEFVVDVEDLRFQLNTFLHDEFKQVIGFQETSMTTLSVGHIELQWVNALPTGVDLRVFADLPLDEMKNALLANIMNTDFLLSDAPQWWKAHLKFPTHLPPYVHLILQQLS